MTNEQMMQYLTHRSDVSAHLITVLVSVIAAAQTAISVAEYDPPERRFAGSRSLKKALEQLAALDLVDKAES